MKLTRDPRIAVCHEWTTTYGGSEQVASRMAHVLRASDVYTFVADPDLATRLFPDAEVHTLTPDFLQPLARRHWGWLLPMMPRRWAKADVSQFEVIVTSSHSCVNAVRAAPGAVHISYCHTPMRYAWDWRSELGRVPAIARPAWPPIAALLRKVDRESSRNVTTFIANSRHVAGRIRRYYQRNAEVVYPPIDIGFWAPGETAKGDYFLLAGRLVAYKEADTAVRSANEGGFPLVIAGSGPQLALLQKIARPNISFVEAPSTERMRELYRGAQALIVPGIEDFGMTMVEAQACGTPVVARKGGGAVEAVAHGVTGYLYEGREPAALTRAIADFDSSSYAPADLRAHVEHFKVERFDKEILDIVARSTLVGRGKAAE